MVMVETTLNSCRLTHPDRSEYQLMWHRAAGTAIAAPQSGRIVDIGKGVGSAEADWSASEANLPFPDPATVAQCQELVRA
jgi:hypothetical protein